MGSVDTAGQLNSGGLLPVSGGQARRCGRSEHHRPSMTGKAHHSPEASRLPPLRRVEKR
jgi:hypothetical protein